MRFKMANERNEMKSRNEEMMADLDKVLKRIPDDVVEYYIYPTLPSDIYDEDEIQEYLERQHDAIFAHLSKNLVNYIWQHEPFNLRPIAGGDPPHLHGSTSFGDNIDDEWFIVSLLYEITREFAGTVVKVNDNDEEFLLIEAAESLPKWLDPETAENRVYVYNGDLHAIPIPQSPEEFAKYPMFSPTVSEGVDCVRNCVSDTRCSQAVQNCINKRLSQFPRKLKENIHNVNCYLPISLAALLSDQPSFVSEAVRRFYYRDPLELKACRPMKIFTPKDLVRTRVKMTRCLYAQLVQQQFTPDRRDSWPISSPSSKEFSERDIGMKLAHGFEILCHKCPNVDTVSNKEFQNDRDPRWLQFQTSLKNKGFFRNEIEGSKLYKQLFQEAKQFFLSQISSNQSDHRDTALKVMGHIKRLEPTFVNFRKQQELLPSDDDSWLNVTPEQVDEMMKSAGGVASPRSSETFDLSKIAESMSSFVDHESSIDGAEFPKDCKEPDEGDGDGQFQSSGLIQQMQKIFEFSDDHDSSGSDMSEYDWSENSEEDTGSPTKMPGYVRKSNQSGSTGLRSNLKKKSTRKERNAKSVRFSTPDSPPKYQSSLDKSQPSSDLTSPVSEDPKPTFLPPTTPTRPERLHMTSPAARPVQPPPPRPPKPAAPPRPSSKPASSLPSQPSNPPPPLPPQPPKRRMKPRPLSKPTATAKPNTPPPPPPPRPSKEKKDKKLEALMDAMDRELATTEVGKSFERTPKQKNNNKGKQNGKPASAGNRDIDDEDDDFSPVNVDLNVVKNTLESYKAQQGLPGPATNILSGFGIKIPQDNSKT